MNVMGLVIVLEIQLSDMLSILKAALRIQELTGIIARQRKIAHCFVNEPGVRNMKALDLSLLIATAMITSAAMAQDEGSASDDPAAPPPLPPKVQGEQIEPTVNIRRDEEDNLIEEYSLNGRVYMVKVTPKLGIPYYYLDDDGDGKLELQAGQEAMNPVQPVYWKIKEW